ncbi:MULTISPECIES: DUF5376 family protein [unclassified Acinetobacter]|uniref:DUF5376 family protein n=1 Tax=unclassified Acinetobacter TaxID=196816 RepID=UPI0035B9EBFD
MYLKFYFLRHELWDTVIPAILAENNKEAQILSYYLSEIDLDFANVILTHLQNDNNFDLSSQSWGVEVEKNKVIINFLYDEENKEFTSCLSTVTFKKALALWAEFLKKQPNVDYEEHHTIGVED